MDYLGLESPSRVKAPLPERDKWLWERDYVIFNYCINPLFFRARTAKEFSFLKALLVISRAKMGKHQPSHRVVK